MVKGMHCASCASNITKKLMKKKGVVRAEVNFATEKAMVEFDNEMLSEQGIVDTIKNAGYGAEIITGATHAHAELEKQDSAARMKKILYFSLIFSVPALLISMFVMD